MKQSNAIFKGDSDPDCLVNARKNEYLNRFKKMGKVEFKNALKNAVFANEVKQLKSIVAVRLEQS